MSETAPVYIPCAAGNNAFSDLLVMARGDLIRLLGHPQMDLTPADAAKLAKLLFKMAREAGWRDPDD
jgi:hypothetical protein